MDNIILNSLDIWFKYRKINKDIKYSFTDTIHNIMPVAIPNTVGAKPINYNLIGNYKEPTFTWAWNLNIPNRSYIKTKQLLLYALNMDINTLQDTYIKTLLTTSSHKINKNEDLIMIISLSLYLTKAHALFMEEFDDGHIDFYGSYEIDQELQSNRLIVR